MQIAGTSPGNHLLLCPFHLHFPTVPVLCHIRVSVLMHGLLSILAEKQYSCGELTVEAETSFSPPPWWWGEGNLTNRLTSKRQSHIYKLLFARIRRSVHSLTCLLGRCDCLALNQMPKPVYPVSPKRAAQARVREVVMGS